MGLIWNLILGAIAGFIATGIMHENTSWIKNILLGIVGGFVGGLVFRYILFSRESIQIELGIHMRVAL